ncbi:MAG: peptidylprolyl isomerase A [Gammaproteobacteria bacterium]|nr:peptidylprolyl isomerase A [Gammaproteobacteria bacterium]
MNYILRTFFTIILLFSTTQMVFASPKPVVEIDTTMGTILVELNHKRAPATVANFLYYVKKGYYDGTIFHRVIYNFMIQGGGFDTNHVQKPTRSPIKNESNNGLLNSTGTIAMARTEDVDSATSQFYINVNENRPLDATFRKLGYTVFGVVIDGLDVVMQIADVETERVPALGENSPIEPVIIKSIKLLEGKVAKPAKKEAIQTIKIEEEK